MPTPRMHEKLDVPYGNQGAGCALTSRNRVITGFDYVNPLLQNITNK